TFFPQAENIDTKACLYVVASVLCVSAVSYLALNFYIVYKAAEPTLSNDWYIMNISSKALADHIYYNLGTNYGYLDIPMLQKKADYAGYRFPKSLRSGDLSFDVYNDALIFDYMVNFLIKEGLDSESYFSQNSQWERELSHKIHK